MSGISNGGESNQKWKSNFSLLWLLQNQLTSVTVREQRLVGFLKKCVQCIRTRRPFLCSIFGDFQYILMPVWCKSHRQNILNGQLTTLKIKTNCQKLKHKKSLLENEGNFQKSKWISKKWNKEGRHYGRLLIGWWVVKKRDSRGMFCPNCSKELIEQSPNFCSGQKGLKKYFPSEDRNPCQITKVNEGHHPISGVNWHPIILPQILFHFSAFHLDLWKLILLYEKFFFLFLFLFFKIVFCSLEL